MIKKICASVILCLFCFCLAFAQNKTPLEKRVDDIAKQFSANPGGYKEIFDKALLAEVPETTLTGIFANYFEQYGRCIKTIYLTNNQSGIETVEFIFEKGFAISIDISVESSEHHYINGLRIVTLPHKVLNNFSEVTEVLKTFPGETSFAATKIKNGKLEMLAAHNADTQLAIGSAFKLYVLSELVRSVKAGERRWTDVVNLQANSIALSSGVIYRWPVGSPVTLHTLASLMISISDNTATDNLIEILGREKIEKMLSIAGNAKPERSFPLLKTNEMFKLKYEPSEKIADLYLAKDANARREMLANEISKIDIKTLKIASKLAYVPKLEWFGSANDMCRVMNWLREQTESDAAKPAREILAIEPGLPISKKDWAYIGYKGGSEAGVLNLTFLLQSQKGEWYFLSIGWNNASAVLEDAKLIEFARHVVRLLQQAQ